MTGPAELDRPPPMSGTHLAHPTESPFAPPLAPGGAPRDRHGEPLQCAAFVAESGVDVAERRAWPSLALRWVIPALAVLATATPARADDVLPPRDYDAADPNRDVVTYLHAAANAALTSYIIWQFDWILPVIKYIALRDEISPTTSLMITSSTTTT